MYNGNLVNIFIVSGSKIPLCLKQMPMDIVFLISTHRESMKYTKATFPTPRVSKEYTTTFQKMFKNGGHFEFSKLKIYATSFSAKFSTHGVMVVSKKYKKATFHQFSKRQPL